MTPFLSLAASLLLIGAVTSEPAPGMAVGSIEAHHGVVFKNFKVGEATNGVVSISNEGSTPDTLTGVSCPLADTTSVVDAKGQPVGDLTIQPGKVLNFSLKGTHILLSGIHFTVDEGSVVPCTLSFSAAGDIQVLLYEADKPVA